ncbi:MAG: hypothetical protein AB1483_02150 [Candidatus Zixiibacteriota bacterium]
MHENYDLTPVVLLATIHNGDRFRSSNAKEYTERLRMLLEEIQPDVVCSELSPEQLRGDATCECKPEYPEVIIPFCSERNIPIVPIQPDVKTGDAVERDLAEAGSKLDPAGRARIDSLEQLECSIVDRLAEILRQPTGLDMIQMRVLDLLLIEPLYQLYSEFSNQKVQALWEEWNQHFLRSILDAVNLSRNKRILATVGWAHKYWLWNHLSKRNDIRLLDLHSFRQFCGESPSSSDS